MIRSSRCTCAMHCTGHGFEEQPLESPFHCSGPRSRQPAISPHRLGHRDASSPLAFPETRVPRASCLVKGLFSAFRSINTSTSQPVLRGRMAATHAHFRMLALMKHAPATSYSISGVFVDV